MKRKREKSQNTFTWLSLKISGADILEVACIMTDQNLNHVSPCFKAFVNYPDIKEYADSPFTLKDIESALLQFIKDRAKEKTSILAGINIGLTLCFLRQMPSVHQFLSHRTIDVGSIRELCWKWNPVLYRKYDRKTHKEILMETKEAIAELLWYRKNFFVCKKRMLILSAPKKPRKPGF